MAKPGAVWYHIPNSRLGSFDETFFFSLFIESHLVICRRPCHCTLQLEVLARASMPGWYSEFFVHLRSGIRCDLQVRERSRSAQI